MTDEILSQGSVCNPDQLCYNTQVKQSTPMHEDEFLSRVVVDTSCRKFYLYSDNGDEKIIDCDTIDEFMGVLDFCREVLDDDVLAYAGPLVAMQN